MSTSKQTKSRVSPAFADTASDSLSSWAIRRVPPSASFTRFSTMRWCSGTLSGGMRIRSGIVSSLMGPPALNIGVRKRTWVDKRIRIHKGIIHVEIIILSKTLTYQPPDLLRLQSSVPLPQHQTLPPSLNKSLVILSHRDTSY